MRIVAYYHKVLDLLMPPRCPMCSNRTQDHQLLCSTCFTNLSQITDPYCQICSYPFDVPMPKGSSCGQCLKSAPVYDGAISAARYGDAARDMVLQLKHGRQYAVAPVMTRLMTLSLKRYFADMGLDIAPSDMVITPVPLHWSRLLKRRFNQSAMLAKDIASKIDIQYEPQLLKRRRATPTQGGLNRKDRIKNVRGAFTVNEKVVPLNGKTVILVDDVLTTGATVEACTLKLKKAGAGRVYILTFARVVKS